mmetsp:Transcript_19973/g.19282  ORF Transcript_19973/g.19282 Transcript_19973/m.19282 type:complete len:140 (+) Transcript_19973:75-494(+)
MQHMEDYRRESADSRTCYSGSIVSKFCNFGLVTSKKWNSTYVTILDGSLRIYDSQDSCTNNPHSHVLEIILGKNHRASEITKKDYSTDKMKIIEFHCFNVEIDNGIFSATKLIKIGSMDPRVAKSIADSIKIHSRSFRI